MSVPTVPYWVEKINDGQGTREENNREWWRWHFAGQLLRASHENTPRKLLSEAAVAMADALITELERPKP
jgi:hypothetical protein